MFALIWMRTQCSTCINKWASVAKAATCPLCRTPVVTRSEPIPSITNEQRRQMEHLERAAARSAAEERAAQLVQAAQVAGRPRAERTIRERVESEHQQRTLARARRLEFERRVDSYMSFTPSGRPYDSLPLISLGEVREIHKENQRNSTFHVSSAKSLSPPLCDLGSRCLSRCHLSYCSCGRIAQHGMLCPLGLVTQLLVGCSTIQEVYPCLCSSGPRGKFFAGVTLSDVILVSIVVKRHGRHPVLSRFQRCVIAESGFVRSTHVACRRDGTGTRRDRSRSSEMW